MILVTGGTGLLGSHLVYQLLTKGYAVRVLLRSNTNKHMISNVFNRHGQNFEPYAKQLEWMEGDVLDLPSLENALSGVSHVYHCAAMVSFTKADKEKLLFTNVQGTINLLNMSLEAKVEKFCHVSSIATLSSEPDKEFTDESEPWKDIPKSSAYAQSKMLAEREVWRAMTEGLNAVIVNPSVILGAGNWNSGSCELFKLVDKGLKYYTTGVNGYVDVEDVARAMIALMESHHNKTRYLLNGGNHSYKEIFDWIALGLGQKVPHIKVNKLMSELAWRLYAVKGILSATKPAITRETARSSQKVYKYSSQKIMADLGFSFTPINVCIEQTCAHYRKENPVR
jgi:nucleoside-diphosphate-sugar epimerase